MKALMKAVSLAVLILAPFCNDSVFAQDQDYQCEVMTVEGNAFKIGDGGKTLIKEGDILKADDRVEVAEGGSVDLAFDSDWKNVARIEEKSSVSIQSIFPVNLKMDKGGIYAKLKALPSESSFTVETPTAIAAARGTEYRTAVENGETNIYNFSESDVYVFGMNEKGSVDETPQIIKNNEKSAVKFRGDRPIAPVKMESKEFERGKLMQGGIDKKIQQVEGMGRRGKIQGIDQVKRAYENGQRKDPEKAFLKNTAPPGRQKELEQKLKERAQQNPANREPGQKLDRMKNNSADRGPRFKQEGGPQMNRPGEGPRDRGQGGPMDRPNGPRDAQMQERRDNRQEQVHQMNNNRQEGGPGNPNNGQAQNNPNKGAGKGAKQGGQGQNKRQ